MQSRITKPHALSWINKVEEDTPDFPKSIQGCYTTNLKDVHFVILLKFFVCFFQSIFEGKNITLFVVIHR